MFFKVNEENNRYIMPIVKIVICVLIICLCVNRDIIQNEYLDFCFKIMAVFGVVLCTLSIYLSIAEIFIAYDNRKKDKLEKIKINNIDYTCFKTEKLINILLDNDIIEFVIIVENKLIKIGSSSDCDVSNYIFFDKAYYIDEQEYEDIEIFRRLSGLYPLDASSKPPNPAPAVIK